MLLRLTDEEREKLREKAQHLTLPEYARQVLLGAPAVRPIRRINIDRAELVRTAGELRKIGSNLNQIARVYNTSGRERPALLDAALTDLHGALVALYALMGIELK